RNSFSFKHLTQRGWLALLRYRVGVVRIIGRRFRRSTFNFNNLGFFEKDRVRAARCSPQALQRL
ncbi:hypothetical protein RYH74_25545, partial [Pseudomonas sp. LSJ-87]|uniref:hypothetical protein n=1 Tax=Pseudomonas sp. LSJ-87 TaxID=3079932 RepID=UPI0029414805